MVINLLISIFYIFILLPSQNTMRFGALRRSLGDVTQQMLTKQLREMERDKLINRKVYHVVPPKVEYSLTDLGRSSLPILKSLHHWGDTKKRTINKVIEKNYAEVANL